MKRQELIRRTLIKYSISSLKKKDLIGVSTTLIANELLLLRNNVSMELNNLVKTGLAIKIKGKPVGYFSIEALNEIYPSYIFKNIYNNLSDFLLDLKNNAPHSSSKINLSNNQYKYNNTTISSLHLNTCSTPPPKIQIYNKIFLIL